MGIHLGTTFDESISVPFKKAIAIARPGYDGALWYRLPSSIEGNIEGKKEYLIGKIKEALNSDNSNDRREKIKEVFVELLLTLETGFTVEQVNTIIGNFDKFSSDLIVPIEELSENTFLLNESYGPTNAFKDIALQMVTSMVSIIVEEQNRESIKEAVNNGKKGQKLKFVITQTSTSGDTGPAGGAGIEGKDFVMNVIGFPVNEATFSQKAQMMGLSGNVLSIPMNESFSAIQEAMLKGNTQEYQKLLKEVLEKEFSDLIEEYGFEIEVDSGSFNSINPGRIDGQMIYHEYGLLQAEAKGIIGKKEEIIEVIPSGNGGHVFSVLMARLASGYKGKTLITCNSNNLFYDIVERGAFKKPVPGSAKDDPSVSMIIEYPNNMIRLFSYLYGPERAKEITDIFFRGEEVVLSSEEHLAINLRIYAIENSGEEELETIRNIFEKTGRLVCPHTANAIKGLEKYRNKFSSVTEIKALISETASPWKFLAATAAALNSENDGKKMQLYKEYKKLENTKNGANLLLEIIKKKYGDFGKPFDLSILPENLRKIYENGYEEGKSCDPKQFQERTLNFLETTVAPMFRKQIETILKEENIGKDIEDGRNKGDI